MRNVKIVCTIGPSCAESEVFNELVNAGLNVARFNFSHGDYETHKKMLNMVRTAEAHRGIPIATLLDTKGPEIRTGILKERKPVKLVADQLFDLVTFECDGDSEKVHITYDKITEEVNEGQNLFIDDGAIHLVVEKIQSDRISCRVIVGGVLGERKGVNFPDAHLSVPTLTEKDVEDIRWGVEQQMDYIAVSFVRNRNDILEVRRVLETFSGDMKVIAKIETRQALENLDAIVQVVDGIMVARGDLGVEIPTEDVPLAQKRIIETCRLQGKPVIVATQMLDSMINQPRPTRAEASDVANAVLDGTDAVMLSGETASGKYPVEAVKTMVKIIERTEEGACNWCHSANLLAGTSVADSVSHAAMMTAKEIGATAILSLTRSGSTARMVSKYRPSCNIVATTPLVKTWRQLALVWGVRAILLEDASSTDQAIASATAIVEEKGFVRAGDSIVVTTGFPVFVSGTTNMLLVQTIGRVLVKGQSLVKKESVGFVCSVATPEEALEKMNQGNILVVSKTNDDFIPAIKKAAAVIVEETGMTNHTSLASLNFGIPCITGVEKAREILKNGSLVTVDAVRGVVYEGRVDVK